METEDVGSYEAQGQKTFEIFEMKTLSSSKA